MTASLIGDYRQNNRFLTFLNHFHVFILLHWLLIPMHNGAGAFSPGMKHPGRGVDHSPYLGLMLRASASISLPSSCSCMTWYDETFTFTVSTRIFLLVMIRRLMNDELQGIWKDAVIHNRSLLKLCLPRCRQSNYDGCQMG